MTKQELIERVYRNLQEGDAGAALSKKAVQGVVEGVFEELTSYFVSAKLGRGDVPRFTYPAFGTFTKRRRLERVGRNPRTGEAITIPETFTLAFAPGQDLKNALNGVKRPK
jgi:nucleoid DNA-binding protein